MKASDALMGRGSSRPLQGAALPVVAAAVCWHIGCVFALDDAEGWLLAHNTRRQYFHSKFGKEFKPLLWSGTLADSSKEYADYLVGQNCKFQHCIDTQGRSRCRFGENLGMNWGSRTPRTAEEVLTSWTVRPRNTQPAPDRKDSPERPSGRNLSSLCGQSRPFPPLPMRSPGAAQHRKNAVSRTAWDDALSS